MNRNFVLEEIGFEDYNTLCSQFGITSDPSEYSLRNGEPTELKKYFEILDRVTYNGVNEILTDVSDDVQSARCVWFADGDIPIGEARRLTSKSRRTYFSTLDEQEKYRQLVIEISNRTLYKRRYYDRFEFHKQDDVWLLKCFHIRRWNLGLYVFDSIPESTFNSVHAISGIYTGN